MGRWVSEWYGGEPAFCRGPLTPMQRAGWLLLLTQCYMYAQCMYTICILYIYIQCLYTQCMNTVCVLSVYILYI